MKQTTTRLPPAEYALLGRCRAMSEEISRIQANLSLARSLPCTASPVALLSEHGVQSHHERIAQQEQRLEALKAEFAPIREQAQHIADKIRSSSFRRFCELYCIDGIDLCFVPEFCGCSQRSADRYAALIHNTTTDRKENAMERITDFTETLAPMDRGDAQGDIYTAEKNLLEIINDLRLSTVQHNALMGAIDRYRNLCEECARAFTV